MTWFKVDDKFHSHPKVCGLSLAACGLWTKSGSWCSDHLTDGFVPRGAVLALGGTPELAAELVDAGLWVIVERGWQFHDWSDHQPSGDEIRAKRAEAKERMKRVRSQPVRGNNGRTVGEQDAKCAGGSPSPDPDPDPDPEEEREAQPKTLEPETAWVRLGLHYKQLYEAEQEGTRNPRPYDEQRIISTDARQFQKLLKLVNAEAARSGIGAQQIFSAAAQSFLRDPKQREKGHVLEFFMRDFAHYVDRAGICCGVEAAS